MKQEMQRDCGACPFFKFCAAYIIQEKIRDQKRIKGSRIHEKKWCNRFCFADFVSCIHFEDRKKLKPLIVREKERFGLLQ